MGPAGAWFADIAFLLFGASGYLFPILVLIAGVFLFRGDDLPEKAAVIWRGAGFLLVIATSSGLATLHFQSPRSARDGGRHSRPDRRSRSRVRRSGCSARRCCCSCCGWRPCSSRPASRGSRSWIARAASCIRASRRCNEWLGDARIWWEGRRAKQQRDEVVSKVRAKPKTAAPRIEPVIEKIEVSPRATRAARARAPGPDVRAAAVERAAGAVAARQSAAERGRLLARGARSDVAARRAQAQRFRRRGRGRRRASRVRSSRASS